MSHTSEKRWPFVRDAAAEAATTMVAVLLAAESAYKELQELYAFVGSTAQGLADQLFLEDWQARSTQGVQAVLTVDFVAGAVDAVTVNNGGTGYTDGVGFTFVVQGGDGLGTISYDVVAGVVGNASVANAGGTYGDALGQPLVGFPAAGSVADTEANAEEVAKAQDLIDAATSLHEMYQAADNVAVPAEDRFTQLRRFT